MLIKLTPWWPFINKEYRRFLFKGKMQLVYFQLNLECQTDMAYELSKFLFHLRHPFLFKSLIRTLVKRQQCSITDKIAVTWRWTYLMSFQGQSLSLFPETFGDESITRSFAWSYFEAQWKSIKCSTLKSKRSQITIKCYLVIKSVNFHVALEFHLMGVITLKCSFQNQWIMILSVKVQFRRSDILPISYFLSK